MEEQAAARPRGWLGRAYWSAYRASDLAATKLALTFGFVWTIWVFFVIPLVAEFFPVNIQAKVFYYASGWVQLFALPLMVYVSNKIQKTADAQALAQGHLLERNTELTEQTAHLTELVHQLLATNTEMTGQVSAGLGRNREMFNAIAAARESQERYHDAMLERIEAVVTSNASLTATIEGFSRDSNRLAHSIDLGITALREQGITALEDQIRGNNDLVRSALAELAARPPRRGRPPGGQGAPPG